MEKKPLSQFPGDAPAGPLILPLPNFLICALAHKAPNIQLAVYQCLAF